MNYEKMSDFEINHKVATALDLNPETNGVSVFFFTHERDIKWLDYCNNPSDAWPIIMENFISIDQHYNGSYIRVWGYCDSGLISMQCLRKDALRTAMIVFLKMMEANRG